MDDRAYRQRICDERNANMARTDIEWALNANGEMYLRDRADFTRWNTNAIERRHEQDRRDWQASQRRASNHHQGL